jgi:hypothetical protein
MRAGRSLRRAEKRSAFRWDIGMHDWRMALRCSALHTKLVRTL